jgi:hypothetical protein
MAEPYQALIKAERIFSMLTVLNRLEIIPTVESFRRQLGATASPTTREYVISRDTHICFIIQMNFLQDRVITDLYAARIPV